MGSVSLESVLLTGFTATCWLYTYSFLTVTSWKCLFVLFVFWREWIKKLGVILPLIWCFTDMHVKDCGNTQNKEVLARSLQFSRCYTATCSTFVRLLIFRLALVDPAWLSLEFYVNGTDTTVSFGGRSTQWLISLPVRQKKEAAWSSLRIFSVFQLCFCRTFTHFFFVCWSFLTFSGSSTIHVLALKLQFFYLVLMATVIHHK